MLRLSAALRIDPRTLLAVCHDLVAAGLAWVGAFWLRLNLPAPTPFDEVMIGTLPIVVCIQGLIFSLSRLYRGIWRYASVYDFRRIVLAVGVAALAVPTALVLVRLSAPIPRSVFLLDPLLLLIFMGGGRFAFRLWKEHHVNSAFRVQGTPLLVLGVNDLAERLVREFGHQSRWRIIGLLDTEKRRLGRDIHGVRVVGLIKNVGQIAREKGVSHVVLALSPNQYSERKRAMQWAANAGLKVLSAPTFEEMLTGKAAITQLKDVAIEDLLGRTPVTLDSEEVSRLITGRSIMVTGAGGSIGSELARQIAHFGPLRVVLLDISEFALFQAEQVFQRLFPALEIVCATGDVKDAARMADLISRHQVEIMFHAAAYKHVPLMEAENAWEAIRNNVLGTYTVARAAIASGVSKFVLISTDKAVNPTNVMGASKRLAEMVCQALQRDAHTRFVTVRFGNVLGSAGSVVPKFREQIAQGGPVTVTHPEVTRFFMSIQEAAQLVLRAGAMGDRGQVYVLDMGSPVKIVDLAKEVIRLSGLNEEDVPIVFTGLRPGEKLYEELLASDEHTLPTPHPKLRIARARDTDDEMMARILSWITLPTPQSDDTVRQTIRSLVAEYRDSDAVLEVRPNSRLRVVSSR